MKNKLKLTISAIFVLGIFASLGSVILKTAPPPNKSEIVYNEAKTCYDLVMRKSLDSKSEEVVAFSSHDVPHWATKSGLEEFYSPGDKEIKILTVAYQRPWIFQVPASVVGRSWDSIDDEELIIEVINAPKNVVWEGVKKNGLIKRKQ